MYEKAGKLWAILILIRAFDAKLCWYEHIFVFILCRESLNGAPSQRTPINQIVFLFTIYIILLLQRTQVATYPWYDR